MYTVLFLLIIFSNTIEAILPFANYWDELLTILVLIWGIRSFFKKPRILGKDALDWALLLLLVIIGALGNLFHPGLQTEPTVFIRDIMALIKFPVIFFVLQRREISEAKQRKITHNAAILSRWIVVITFVAAVVGRFVDLGFYSDPTKIVRTFEFVFTHATFFVSAYVMIAAVLMADSIEKNRWFILLDCFLLILPLRVKGYTFVVFALLITILGRRRTSNLNAYIFGTVKKKPKIGRIVLLAVSMGIVFVIVGWGKVQNYISWGLSAARPALYVTGVKIMLDCFPLGSGLGTFASFLSGKYYSNIYDLYGISDVNGISETFYNYISDVFWPYIYGQFGIFGLLIYVKLLFSVFIRQYRSNISANARIAAVAVWLYALIASTAEAYFTNGTGVQMALLLTVFIGYTGADTETTHKINKAVGGE